VRLLRDTSAAKGAKGASPRRSPEWVFIARFFPWTADRPYVSAIEDFRETTKKKKKLLCHEKTAEVPTFPKSEKPCKVELNIHFHIWTPESDDSFALE